MSEPTWRNLRIEISRNGGEFVLFLYIRRVKFYMPRATLEAILRHL